MVDTPANDDRPPEALPPQVQRDVWRPGYPVEPRGFEHMEPEGTDWRRYLHALRRNAWLVALLTVLGVAGGMGAVRFFDPEYEVEATVWVSTSTQARGAPDRGPIQQGLLLESVGWVDLLESYVVIDHVVRELQLYLRPKSPKDTPLFAEFALRERFAPGDYRLTVDDARTMVLSTADGRVIERASAGDSIGAAVGFSWRPPANELDAGRRVEFTVATPRDASRQLAERLRPTIDRAGTFLDIHLSGTQPERIALTMNTVLDRYVEIAAQLKREKLTELAGILERQLRRAEQNLNAAENALESFKVNTITLPSDRAAPVAAGLQITQDPVFTNFFEMRVENERIRRDQEALDRALVTARDSVVSVEAFEVIESVQQASQLMRVLEELTTKRAELRALRYRYTDEHPPVQRLVSDIETLETRTIPVMAGALSSELAVRASDLAGRLASASRELQRIPPRAIEEARLEREVAIADNLYTMLQARYEEARLAEASSIPDIRIMDRAIAPQYPVRNRGPQLLLMGLLGGLGLGIVAALFRDRLDQRIRYPDQVTTQMGLPILGVVPHLKGSNGRSDSSQPVIEAFRGVRLNVTHAYGAAGPLLITVTSPGSGDGKSLVAANLALAFADAGHRTLLMDGDSRRGQLHRMMDRPRKPGLTDHLAQKRHDDPIHDTQFDNLFFMGCGTRMNRAPELLGSAGMTELLVRLRSLYGVIVVDSPPLGAGVDAYALSAATGNCLLVLRTGTTDRDQAEAKLDVLDRLPIRLLGAVLNDVREWNVYRYYGYYLPGYEQGDEDFEEEPKKLLQRKT